VSDLRFELLLSTRAFAGGAEHSRTDGLRPPTVKALLRFWWRALHPELKGAGLFQRESAIFGDTTRQGLSIVPIGYPGARKGEVLPKGAHEAFNEKPYSWRSYAAFGPVQRERYGFDAQNKPLSRNQTTVEAVETSFRREFAVRGACVSPDPAMVAVQAELKAALWLMSVFGGIGSRSRRGNGALCVVPDGWKWDPLPDLACAETVDKAGKMIATGLKLCARLHADANPAPYASQPEHPALWKDARCLVGFSAGEQFFADAGDAHAAAIHDYYWCRRSLGWYRKGDPCRPKYAGAPGSPEGADHRWRVLMARASAAPSGLVGPRATHFGLPIMGFMLKSKKNVDAVVSAKGADRRASPLLISIVRCGDQGYLPVLLYLPSTFLPPDALKVETVKTYPARASRSDRLVWSEAAADPSDGAVVEFLDKLTSVRTGTEPWEFPQSNWGEVTI
jgi:CRISPR-associated protein Cmr1